nr:uncharacterized protein LOC117688805 [Crassostrea gigas]XP_034323141.1 uncharacterized protein LOC117688805 [Crassostrea gigas]
MKTTTDISDVTVSSKDGSKGTIANFLLSAVMLLICIFCCKAGRNICECIKSFLLQGVRSTCCDNASSRLTCCDDVSDRLTCCDHVSCDCSSCLKRIHQGREALASRVREYWERYRSNSRNNAHTEAPPTVTPPPDRLLLDDHSIHSSLNEDYSHPSPTHIPPPSYGSVVTASSCPPPSYEEFQRMDVSTNAIIRALSADSVIPAQNDYDSDDSFVSAISYQLANSTQEIPVLFDSILNNSSQPSSCYEDFQRMDDSSHTSNAARAPSSCFVPLPPTDDSFPNNDSSHRANSSQDPPPPSYDSVVTDPALPPPSYDEM